MSDAFIQHSKPDIRETDLLLVGKQLRSRDLASGQLVNQFELKASGYIGYKFGYATNTGSSALLLLLKYLAIRPGDEVIVPLYSCPSIARTIELIGAIPVHCDSSLYWNSTGDDIKAKVTSSTRAIILVHMYGIDASSEAVYNIGIPVIDDLCQSFGIKQRFQNPYSLAFTSFGATKCLTTGKGGMAFSNSDLDFAEFQSFVFELRQLSDLSASLGLGQLQRYSQMLDRRKEIANQYLDAFAGTTLDLEAMSKLFSESSQIGDGSIFYRFVVRCQENIDKVISTFASRYRINLRKGVDFLQTQDTSRFPNAVNLFRTSLSIPLYPALDASEILRTSNAIKEHFHA
jgi:perosamine synthetase